MSMQQVVMNKIKSIFDETVDPTYSWVDKPDWSNTGAIYFFDSNLSTLGSFTYNFQDSYFTVIFFEANAKPIHSIGGSPLGLIDNIYGQYHSLPTAIDKIRSAMTKIFSKKLNEDHAPHHH